MLTNKINIRASLSTATGSRIPCNPCLTAGRVGLPITDHSPITEQFFKSPSFVLHFERFKMLWERHLKI
jgi:hypothetical protein